MENLFQNTAASPQMSEQEFFANKSLCASIDHMIVTVETRDRIIGIYQMVCGAFFNSAEQELCTVDLATGEEFHSENEIREHLTAHYHILPEKIQIEIDPNHR